MYINGIIPKIGSIIEKVVLMKELIKHWLDKINDEVIEMRRHLHTIQRLISQMTFCM